MHALTAPAAASAGGATAATDVGAGGATTMDAAEAAANPAAGNPGFRLRPRGRFIGARQINRNRGSLPELAVDGDRPARLMRKAVHLRKAETAPLVRLLGREKRIEDFRQHVGRNA
jgi:hypothetical protein